MKTAKICLVLLTTISLVNSFGFLQNSTFLKKFDMKPAELFGMEIEKLSQLPILFFTNVLTKVCSQAIFLKDLFKYDNIDITKLKLTLITTTKNISVSLNQPTSLWNSTYFKSTAPVIIFIHGFQPIYEEATNIPGEVMAKAFLNRGNSNFILMETANYIHTLYSWAAFNAELVGVYLGDALASLKGDFPYMNIHLIGFSIGAHIAGEAGRQFVRKTGTKLTHITALDPARPCFKRSRRAFAIKKVDALFIDVIHSDNRGYGFSEPVGDVDFYLNGDILLQPGCETLGCSHERAYMTYVETVYPGHENDFPSIQCVSFRELKGKKCKGDTIMMGYGVPHNASGLYYLKTRASYPYGENGNYSN